MSQSMRAIRFSKTGDASVMEWVARPVPVPGEGQVLIRGSFAGVNMIDTYFRKGLYPAKFDASGSAGLGGEGVGTIAALGKGVAGLSLGQRVASASAVESYAQFFLAEADKVIAVPEGVADEVAAAALLKGMTARYLVKETFRVGPGTTALVYAAAGGTGQIITQWVKQLGGRVIAVVSTPEKAAVARGLGADHVVLSSDNIAARVREIVKEGVDVA